MRLSSVVVVPKSRGRIRICVDFRDLNKACPKDEFPLPILDIMVDAQRPDTRCCPSWTVFQGITKEKWLRRTRRKPPLEHQ